MSTENHEEFDVVVVGGGPGGSTFASLIAIRDWLDIFEMSSMGSSPSRSQLAIDMIPNRLESYRHVKTDCLVLAFKDDLMVPPYLCREVADHIPGSKYQEIAGCGHYGYIEEPAAVNSSLIDFFRGALDRP